MRAAVGRGKYKTFIPVADNCIPITDENIWRGYSQPLRRVCAGSLWR